MSDEKWNDNTIQFPRFIAEAEAAGAFTEDVTTTMAESMDLNVDDLCSIIDRAQAKWEDAKTFTARFVPQAWVRDNAIDVDPEGDTEWDVTAAFMALPENYRVTMLYMMSIMPGAPEALDKHDLLKSDPNAPEWVRNWSGPFDLYVRRGRP